MLSDLQKKGIKKPQSIKIKAFRWSIQLVSLVHYQAFGHQPQSRLRQY